MNHTMRVIILFCYALLSTTSLAQNTNDTVPPSPPPPYLLVDWNSPNVKYSNQNGFELLSIEALPCGVTPDSSFVFSVQNEILTASYTVNTNCCMDFVARISSEATNRLQLELYMYGFEICTCNCMFTFRYKVRIINVDHPVELSVKYMTNENDAGEF